MKKPEIINFFKKGTTLEEVHKIYENNPELWAYIQAQDKYMYYLESEIDKKQMIDIGQRFIEITDKLNNLGVFYGKNYNGKYHDKYPHSSYSFSIDLDKHRGGFEANILNNGDVEKTIAVVSGDNPALMIVELLEKSYEYLINDLNIQ
jgi:hypothetical protein